MDEMNELMRMTDMNETGDCLHFERFSVEGVRIGCFVSTISV